jgi:DNA-binding transcriptional LysR family regulator
VREVSLEARAVVLDPPAAYQLVVAGIGVAMLAQSVMVPEVESGRLVRLLPEWEPEPVQVYALYSARLDSSPKVRAFLNFLHERLGRELPPDIRPRL